MPRNEHVAYYCRGAYKHASRGIQRYYSTLDHSNARVMGTESASTASAAAWRNIVRRILTGLRCSNAPEELFYKQASRIQTLTAQRICVSRLAHGCARKLTAQRNRSRWHSCAPAGVHRGRGHATRGRGSPCKLSAREFAGREGTRGSAPPGQRG
jgi:hypothetical protein